MRGGYGNAGGSRYKGTSSALLLGFDKSVSAGDAKEEGLRYLVPSFTGEGYCTELWKTE